MLYQLWKCKLKFDESSDVYKYDQGPYTPPYTPYPQSYKRLLCKFFIFQLTLFSQLILHIDTCMLKLWRVTKVKVLFLFQVSVFNFNLFEFSATILEKGLFRFLIKWSAFLLPCNLHALFEVVFLIENNQRNLCSLFRSGRRKVQSFQLSRKHKKCEKNAKD